ncbi:hypothetical protein H920_15865 [Fukomys damarensis]|uniref:Uncharacterized protein n=1 Tax=Fukomys damarensis TaxID=885580 RepID=A0A091DIZ0_FUKDA|nr:hypothetical protein H920_15865 [Fukomys damarensis]
MPSASASRKSQEKPREIMDAAEVGFLPPRAWEGRCWARLRFKRGSGVSRASPRRLCRPRPSGSCSRYFHRACMAMAPTAWQTSAGPLFSQGRLVCENCPGGRVDVKCLLPRK